MTSSCQFLPVPRLDTHQEDPGTNTTHSNWDQRHLCSADQLRIWYLPAAQQHQEDPLGPSFLWPPVENQVLLIYSLFWGVRCRCLHWWQNACTHRRADFSQFTWKAVCTRNSLLELEIFSVFFCFRSLKTMSNVINIADITWIRKRSFFQNNNLFAPPPCVALVPL